MSKKFPFYQYLYAASVATAEDPDYEPPEEEEAEEPDLSLEAEGVQDVVVGVSHWVDGTSWVELDLLVCTTGSQANGMSWRLPATVVLLLYLSLISQSP